FREWPPSGAANKGQIAARASGKRVSKYWKDRNRNCDRLAALFSLKRCDAFADMLAPEDHGVASPQAGVKQNVKPYPFLCSDRPVRLVSLDLILSPLPKSRPFPSLRVLDASGRIARNVLGLERPSE